MPRNPLSSVRCRAGIRVHGTVRFLSSLSFATAVAVVSGCGTTPGIESDRTTGDLRPSPESSRTGGSDRDDLFADIVDPAIFGSATDAGPGGPSPSELAAGNGDDEADSAAVDRLEARDAESTAAGTGDEALATAFDGPSTREAGVLPLSLERIDRELAILAAESSDPMSVELVRAMLPVLAIDRVGGEVPAFAPGTTDLLPEETQILEATSAFARTVRRELAEGSRPVREILMANLTQYLEGIRNDSGMRLGRVELCRSISGFGDIEASPRRFAARTDQDILIYAELEGLDWTSRPQGGVGWELRYRLELHQLSDGMLLDPGVERVAMDVLDAPISENFFWIRYRIPAAELNAGRYVLKLRVEEPSTGRQDERAIELDLLPGGLLDRAIAEGS